MSKDSPSEPSSKRRRKSKPRARPKWRHYDVLEPVPFEFSEPEKDNIRAELKEKASPKAIDAFIRAAESEVEGFLAYRRIEKGTPRSAEIGAALREIRKSAEKLQTQLRNLDTRTRDSLSPHLEVMPQRLSQECLPDYRAALLKWRYSPARTDESANSWEFNLNAPENAQLKAQWELLRAKVEADCEQLFSSFRDYTDVTALFIDGLCEAIVLAENARDKSGGGPSMNARAQFIRELETQFQTHLGLLPTKTQGGPFENVVLDCLRAAGDEIDGGTLHSFVVSSLQRPSPNHFPDPST